MAVSHDYNHKLLNAWRRHMEIPIWHYNQIVGQGVYAPLSTPGEGIWVQPEREIVSRAILQAYAMGLNFIRTYHRPEYTHERIQLDPRQPLRRQLLQTRYHHVRAIGQRATTLISAGATITYTDSDGDGVNDTATITAVTTVTDPTEIQVFFRVADGAPEAADRRYEIEPLKVTISGGVATIQGHRALFVKPSIWTNPYNAPNWNASSKNYGSTANVNDFVTTVDVYRVYPDATNAVAYGVAAHCQCAYNTEYGTAIIRDARLGLIELCPPSLCLCGAYYAYVDLYYIAGMPLTDELTPDPALERAFCRLANAEFPRVPPNMPSPGIYDWTSDYMPYAEGDGLPNFANNPFGARTGHIDAWRVMDSDEYRIGYGGMR